jgi:hypothetical protein
MGPTSVLVDFTHGISNYRDRGMLMLSQRMGAGWCAYVCVYVCVGVGRRF